MAAGSKSRQEKETETISVADRRKRVRCEECDSTERGHDLHLLAKETNCTPGMPGSTDEPTADEWHPPQVVNPRSNGSDLEGTPEGQNPV